MYYEASDFLETADMILPEVKRSSQFPALVFWGLEITSLSTLFFCLFQSVYALSLFFQNLPLGQGF